MFSGSFGVRSIVLCKCSGKYIDIYFRLKITCMRMILWMMMRMMLMIKTVAEAPLDRAFARLVDYIYERFPHSEPETVASTKPHCEYESYFSVSDPPEPSREFMKLYPRVSEIQSSSSEYAASLSRESRPLFKILPVRQRAFSIGDDADFCKQRFLNSDFSRICRPKSVLKSRVASITLADLEQLDRVARMILAGDSQCFWFLSALLAQLKEDGYQPSNPSLFDKSITSLSAAQTGVTANMSEYITSKRRESYLSHRHLLYRIASSENF